MRVNAGKPDWTVLYYLNGSNDLEPKLVRNLIDAESVGSSDRVDLAGQLARAPRSVVYGKKSRKSTRLDGDWTGARRYHLQKGTRERGLSSPVLQELPLPDAGAPESLRDFLAWGKANFPAKRTMVVIGDHGKGFVGTGYDYAHKNILDLGELKTALAESGLKPDVLVFDACLMGQLEVASQLKEHAGYLVASEEIVGQDGLPHQAIASFLQARPEATPREVAEAVVQLAGNDQLDRMDEGGDDAAMQLAAINLSRIGAVEKACDELARTMEKASVDPARVAKARRATKNFGDGGDTKPEEDFRDLGHFARLLDEDESLPDKVREAARGVAAALKKAVVAQSREGDGMEDTEGLSVYLPSRLKPEGKARPGGGPGNAWGYRATDFARSTRWDEWLESSSSPGAIR